MATANRLGLSGFHTCDELEQLVGAAMHSADRIVFELQDQAVGDMVRPSRAGGPNIAQLEQRRTLVLHESLDRRTGPRSGRGVSPAAPCTSSWSKACCEGSTGAPSARRPPPLAAGGLRPSRA